MPFFSQDGVFTGFIYAKYNKTVVFTLEALKHITFRHPELDGMLKEVEETLRKPYFVVTSKNDKKVWIYYRFYNSRGSYLCVVVKIYNGEGLLLTSYITDRIKAGEKI